MSSEPPRSALDKLGTGLVILLCVAACTLMLVIPTTSISVDSVYQGF